MKGHVQIVTAALVSLVALGAGAVSAQIPDEFTNLEHYPGSADSQAMIGVIHMETGDAGAATSAFESALALDPENRLAQRGLSALASQTSPEGGQQPMPKSAPTAAHEPTRA